MTGFRRSVAAAAALVAAALVALALPAGASARTLAAVQRSGVLTICVHPNALPFSARNGERHGLQVELGDALARQLGVELEVEWVVAGYHIARVGCDAVLESIVDKEAQAERRLTLSRPYRRSGVALAYRTGAPAPAGFQDLRSGQRIGTLVGSLASVWLGRRGIETIPFGFEDEMVAALAAGELEAALASPASIGFHNLTHPDARVAWVPAYRDEPVLRWDVAVGLRKPDPALVAAVDSGLDVLAADGTLAAIHDRYGIPFDPPDR